MFGIDKDLRQSLLLNKQQRRDTTLTCFHWVYVLILNHDLAHYTEEQLMGLTQIKYAYTLNTLRCSLTVQPETHTVFT